MKRIIVLFLFFQMLSFPAMAQQFKYHIVKRGETTAEIARRYNTTEETIFKYNPDARKGLAPDTKLVVPIRGEVRTENLRFKTHKVKRKETLFSLSQQYNVTVDDIKRYNKHLYSSELRKGERIRIPLNLAVTTENEVEENPSLSNPLDLSVKEHVVLPKETLYGISRKYNITIADLQRLNPNLESLRPGMVLKVKNGNVEKVVDVEGDLFKYYLVKPKETLFSLTRRFGISRDSLVTLNPALDDGLKSGMVLKIPNKDVPDIMEFEAEEIVNLERRLSNFDTKNVAVMLPFNLDKVVKTDTSNNASQRIKKDRVLQISLDFYSGVLMAVDSAKTLGISTQLNTYDTQQSAGKVHAIINSNNFSDTDVVIGPILQSTAEAAASALQFKNVPVISPLTKKQVNSLGNFLQARPSDEMLSQAMISYISENAAGKNMVIIADTASSAKKRELMDYFPSAKLVNPKEGSFIDQEELMAAMVEDQPNWIILEASKIGVLSNTTSYLNSLADKYKITLFTTNKNSSYDSDNVSNNHLGKLSFHFPSVDRVYTSENGPFIKKYREKYGVVPNTYAVRGFDVTYDILLRLASSEDLYSSLNEEGTTQYVENKFSYETKLSGGYQNTSVYIMAYDKNLNLKVVR